MFDTCVNFQCHVRCCYQLLCFDDNSELILGLILFHHMGVSINSDTPKSSILIGFSIINHPFGVPLYLETPIYLCVC